VGREGEPALSWWVGGAAFSGVAVTRLWGIMRAAKGCAELVLA
jgi:hypothetical protein